MDQKIREAIDIRRRQAEERHLYHKVYAVLGKDSRFEEGPLLMVKEEKIQAISHHKSVKRNVLVTYHGKVVFEACHKSKDFKPSVTAYIPGDESWELELNRLYQQSEDFKKYQKSEKDREEKRLATERDEIKKFGLENLLESK